MADDETRASESPAMLLGKYRVERHLGRGGQGDVIVAFDVVIKRRVAIKTIRGAHSPDSYDHEECFLREAEAGARVGDHPNVVIEYDLSKKDQTAHGT